MLRADQIETIVLILIVEPQWQLLNLQLRIYRWYKP